MSMAKAVGAITGIFSILIMAWVSSQALTSVDKSMDDTLQFQPNVQKAYDTGRSIQDTAGTYSDTRDLWNNIVKLLIVFGLPAGAIYGGFRFFTR